MWCSALAGGLRYARELPWLTFLCRAVKVLSFLALRASLYDWGSKILPYSSVGSLRIRSRGVPTTKRTHTMYTRTPRRLWEGVRKGRRTHWTFFSRIIFGPPQQLLASIPSNSTFHYILESHLPYVLCSLVKVIWIRIRQHVWYSRFYHILKCFALRVFYRSHIDATNSEFKFIHASGFPLLGLWCVVHMC